MTSPRVNLFEESRTGITDIMDGPWRDIQVLTLQPGGSRRIESVGSEHSLFVIDGTCTVSVPGGAVFDFAHGSAFALPLTGIADLEAGARGLRALLVTLNV